MTQRRSETPPKATRGDKVRSGRAHMQPQINTAHRVRNMSEKRGPLTHAGETPGGIQPTIIRRFVAGSSRLSVHADRPGSHHPTQTTTQTTMQTPPGDTRILEYEKRDLAWERACNVTWHRGGCMHFPQKGLKTRTRRKTQTNTLTHTQTHTNTHTDTNTQTHKHTNTQTHKHTNTQTYKHTTMQTYKRTNTKPI
jgi:hypothetical protein